MDKTISGSTDGEFNSITVSESADISIINTQTANIGYATITTRAVVALGDFLVIGSGSIANSQGAYLQWNRTGSDGATWFINQRGSGTGGFRWREGNPGLNTSVALGDLNSSRLSIPTQVETLAVVLGGNTTINSSATSPVTFTWPATAGTSGQALKTNGSGALYWG